MNDFQPTYYVYVTAHAFASAFHKLKYEKTSIMFAWTMNEKIMNENEPFFLKC